MYDSILVPTDGSDHAVRAAEHGRVLARAFDATVHVLAVVDVEGADGPFGRGPDDALLEERDADAQDAVESTRAVLDGVDEVRTAVLRGTPSETILDYATDNDVEVIAMGTHGRTGIDRLVAGSVTERVLRLADVPVMAVRAAGDPPGAERYDQVLVPTDGSEAAAAAVDHGVAVAERFDARVHAVNVVDVANLAVSHTYGPPEQLVEGLRSAGEEATEQVAERARAAGLDVETHVVEGVPAEHLLTYAEDSGVDLIAMGTAGRSGLERVLLGSTTERIVRRADVPVLTVRPPDEG
jgi:nucleotide-binding universal stress UspA family protein